MRESYILLPNKITDFDFDSQLNVDFRLLEK